MKRFACIHVLVGLSMFGTTSIAGAAEPSCPDVPPPIGHFWSPSVYDMPTPPVSGRIVDAAVETDGYGRQFGYWVLVRNPSTGTNDLYSRLLYGDSWIIAPNVPNAVSIEETVDGGVAILVEKSQDNNRRLIYWSKGQMYSSIAGNPTNEGYGMWKSGIAVASALENGQLYQTVDGVIWNNVYAAQAPDATMGKSGQAFMTDINHFVHGNFSNGWQRLWAGGHIVADDVTVCNRSDDSDLCVALQYKIPNSTTSKIGIWTGTPSSAYGSLYVATASDVAKVTGASFERFDGLAVKYITTSGQYRMLVCEPGFLT